MDFNKFTNDLAYMFLKLKYWIIWTVLMVATASMALPVLQGLDLSDKANIPIALMICNILTVQVGVFFILWQPHWMGFVDEWKEEYHQKV
jgi:hypothetical protein